MAIIDPWSIPISINSQEYAIRGNMIKYQITMSEYDLMEINPKTFELNIKQQLMDGLMYEVTNTKSVEFTKSSDRITGLTYFRARMFVVPDDQVKILRVSQLNNTTPLPTYNSVI